MFLINTGLLTDPVLELNFLCKWIASTKFARLQGCVAGSFDSVHAFAPCQNGLRAGKESKSNITHAGPHVRKEASLSSWLTALAGLDDRQTKTRGSAVLAVSLPSLNPHSEPRPQQKFELRVCITCCSRETRPTGQGFFLHNRLLHRDRGQDILSGVF